MNSLSMCQYIYHYPLLCTMQHCHFITTDLFISSSPALSSTHHYCSGQLIAIVFNDWFQPPITVHYPFRILTTITMFISALSLARHQQASSLTSLMSLPYPPTVTFIWACHLHRWSSSSSYLTVLPLAYNVSRPKYHLAALHHHWKRTRTLATWDRRSIGHWSSGRGNTLDMIRLGHCGTWWVGAGLTVYWTHSGLLVWHW